MRGYKEGAAQRKREQWITDEIQEAPLESEDPA